MTSRPALRTALALFALCAACRRTPSDLREWTPRDHADAEVDPTAQGPSAGSDPMGAARALFAAQCASCHGSGGHGDGPQAALFRPADLTDGAFQSQRSDEELARSITSGRGRMPAFGSTVRPEGVQLLVRLIRSWRR